ncbi:MAG TPA: hypothetical protein VHD37_01340 [Candidatus Paceibacterota bacterium]|nr:hypothetical protein [Candidatus Paceibacterota bacterium]
MSALQYIIMKAVTHVAALFWLALLWWMLPGILLWGFDTNLVWIGWVWGHIYPLLPPEASLPLQSVDKIYGSLVMIVENMTKLLPTVTGKQVEAATRAALGEGWVLVVEVSFALRIAWMLRRYFRRSEMPRTVFL